MSYIEYILDLFDGLSRLRVVVSAYSALAVCFRGFKAHYFRLRPIDEFSFSAVDS
jgi:hypothetical protein